jgi:benzoyl-CoA 2,3-dioxygenase component B
MRPVPHATDDGVGTREASSLSALNETLRDDYVVDCQKGLDRWNRALAEVGASLELPHVGFNRAVGTFAKRRISPNGTILTEDGWESSVSSWLPTAGDREYVESLMIAVQEPGKMAGWVAPPSRGIHEKPVDYDYVKI